MRIDLPPATPDAEEGGAAVAWLMAYSAAFSWLLAGFVLAPGAGLVWLLWRLAPQPPKQKS